MLKQLNIGELHYHLRPAGVRAEIENTIDAITQKLNAKNLSIFVLSDYEEVFTIKDLRIKTRFKKSRKVKIQKINIPEINYNTKPAKNKKQFLTEANELKQNILKHIPLNRCTKNNPFILHTHSVPLGKNPRLSAAIKLLADQCNNQNKPLWILNQIHDFAENSRPELLQTLQTCTGRFDKKFASEIMYPNTPNIFYAVINSNDSENLEMVGINPKKIFYLPNSVDIDVFTSKPITRARKYRLQLMNSLDEYADKNDYVFDKKRKIILSPLKLMRRKNNIESLLLLLAFNHLRDQYQLLISLEAHAGKDVDYVNKFKKFVRKNKLPVTIGEGQELISLSEKRQFENGKITEFSIIDLFDLSTAIMTTSILEGFGFSFIEGWLTGKAVIGRRLPYVCRDFEKNGMDLDHMYKKIWVPVKWIRNSKKRLFGIYFKHLNQLRKQQGLKPFPSAEVEKQLSKLKYRKINKHLCIDFKELDSDMQLEAIERIFSGKRYTGEFLKINPVIRRMFRLLEKEPKDIIQKNKNVIIENYSLIAKAKNIGDIISFGNSNYLKDGKAKNVDNRKVIEKYLDLDFIHPLTEG